MLHLMWTLSQNSFTRIYKVINDILIFIPNEQTRGDTGKEKLLILCSYMGQCAMGVWVTWECQTFLHLDQCVVRGISACHTQLQQTLPHFLMGGSMLRGDVS